jgi:capsid protein
LANCQVGVIFDSEASIANANAIEAGEPLAEAMEPGRYEFLPPGKDIRFNTPPGAGDYGPFVRDCLLRVAAGYGITFQALTGDLSSVNFSSGRMGWIEFGRNIDAWRWQMLVPQGLDVIAGWFGDMAQVMLSIRADNISVRWDPPRREMINPKQDAEAMNILVRNGFTSWPQALRELGEDPEATLDEIADWQKQLDKLGIKLDCDPRADQPAAQVEPDQDDSEDDSTAATKAVDPISIVVNVQDRKAQGFTIVRDPATGAATAKPITE